MAMFTREYLMAGLHPKLQLWGCSLEIIIPLDIVENHIQTTNQNIILSGKYEKMMMNQWLWGSPSFGQCCILFLSFWVYRWAIHESLPSDFSPALFVALF